jgi:hypothetical protein
MRCHSGEASRAREPNNVALDTTATPSETEAYCGLVMLVLKMTKQPRHLATDRQK